MLPDLVLYQRLLDALQQLVNGVDVRVDRLEPLDLGSDGRRVGELLLIIHSAQPPLLGSLVQLILPGNAGKSVSYYNLMEFVGWSGGCLSAARYFCATPTLRAQLSDYWLPTSVSRELTDTWSVIAIRWAMATKLVVHSWQRNPGVPGQLRGTDGRPGGAFSAV